MKFTVIWLPGAEKALARLWESHVSSRAAITKAAYEIDKILAAGPTEAGESHPGDQRILLVPPLGVTFRASSDDRMVWVGEVWRFEKRPPHS